MVSSQWLADGSPLKSWVTNDFETVENCVFCLCRLETTAHHCLHDVLNSFVPKTNNDNDKSAPRASEKIIEWMLILKCSAMSWHLNDPTSDSRAAISSRSARPQRSNLMTCLARAFLSRKSVFSSFFQQGLGTVSNTAVSLFSKQGHCGLCRRSKI